MRMLPPPAMLTEPMSWRGCAQSFPGRPGQVRAVRAFLARFLAGHRAPMTRCS